MGIINKTATVYLKISFNSIFPLNEPNLCRNKIIKAIKYIVNAIDEASTSPEASIVFIKMKLRVRLIATVIPIAINGVFVSCAL